MKLLGDKVLFHSFEHVSILRLIHPLEVVIGRDLLKVSFGLVSFGIGSTSILLNLFLLL
jgi:hypothetical protein